MSNPEDDVIAMIDALVDWELTDSPAAKVEHGYDDDFAAQIAAVHERLRSDLQQQLNLMDSTYVKRLRRMVITNWFVLLLNTACLVLDLWPLNYGHTPSVSTPFNFLAVVWFIRLVINSTRQLKETRLRRIAETERLP